MSARLLLAGYFGCGNLGDDAILLGFLEGIRDKHYELLTLSGSPDRIMNSYGLRGIPRLDFNEVNKALEEVDALVFPGGSIFQDVTSLRSVGYYYKLVANARRKKKKVIMLGQGVGPLNRAFGKMLTAKAFNMADAIAVRDPSSAQMLKQIGVKTTPRVAADMAFLLPKPPALEESTRYGVGGMKTIGISVRPHGRDKGKGVANLFADVCRRMFAAQNMTVLIEMDQVHDKIVMDMVSKANGGKVPEIRNLASPVAAQQRIARMDGVIAMRLHAGILAATVGVPPFMVSYDPKVTAFANLLGLPSAPSIEGLTSGRLVDLFNDFMRTRDRYAQSLPEKMASLAEQARQNIRVLESVLGE